MAILQVFKKYIQINLHFSKLENIEKMIKIGQLEHISERGTNGEGTRTPHIIVNYIFTNHKVGIQKLQDQHVDIC